MIMKCESCNTRCAGMECPACGNDETVERRTVASVADSIEHGELQLEIVSARLHQAGFRGLAEGIDFRRKQLREDAATLRQFIDEFSSE